jgi:hypothetical protein
MGWGFVTLYCLLTTCFCKPVMQGQMVLYGQLAEPGTTLRCLSSVASLRLSHGTLVWVS